MYVAGVTLGSVTSYIGALTNGRIPLWSRADSISRRASYGVTLGSVTSYISAEWHAAASETICGGIRDYLRRHQRLSAAVSETICGTAKDYLRQAQLGDRLQHLWHGEKTGKNRSDAHRKGMFRAHKP